MKVRMFLTAFCLAMFTSSCDQEEERIYCCNKEINDYVVEHLDNIQKMTRSEWLSCEEEKKGPMFGAFNPEQKVSFWKEKLNEVLLLEWNDLERKHIIELLDFVEDPDNLCFFNTGIEKTEEQTDFFDIFVIKWVEYAYETLKWNKHQVAAIVASGNKMIDKTGQLQINQVKRVKAASELQNCNCNQTWYGDFCGFNATCEDIDCYPVPYCGFLLLQECNGMCEPL